MSEGGIPSEVAPQLPIPIPGDNRLQHVAPAVGAMHVAGPQGAPLQVAELIENEKRVIAGAAEVTVVGCAFLIAMGRADAAVDIEHDRLGRTPLVQAVDPSPGEIRQCGEVPVGGQKFGLEAPHLTGRGSGPGHGATANYPTHCRISTQTVGVVHVFVATKATEDRLPEQSGHCMLAVLARAHLNQFAIMPVRPRASSSSR